MVNHLKKDWFVFKQTDEPNHKVTVRCGDIHLGTGMPHTQLAEVNPYIIDRDEVAHLMAAAPSMLNALELAADELSDFANDENDLQFNIAYKAVRDAIKLAKGVK